MPRDIQKDPFFLAIKLRREKKALFALEKKDTKRSFIKGAHHSRVSKHTISRNGQRWPQVKVNDNSVSY